VHATSVARKANQIFIGVWGLCQFSVSGVSVPNEKNNKILPWKTACILGRVDTPFD
jgi:hypothetical protein